MYRAVVAVQKAIMSICAAALRYHVPKSSLDDNVCRSRDKRKSEKTDRKTTLSREEEETVVNPLLYFANYGITITRTHSQDAVEIFVENLLMEQRACMPFKDDCPGIRYLHAFAMRRRLELKFSVPKFHEGKR